jgi:uncharacterized protein
MPLTYVLTGLLVGTLIGMTGMGGGSLMTPILVLVLGVHPTVAVGTDLAYSTLTKAVGAVQHFRQHQVRVHAALWLAVGSVPASLAGIAMLHLVTRGHTQVADQFVSRALGVTLLFVAAMLFLLPFAQRHLWPENPPPLLHPRLQALRRIRPALLVVVGAFVGFLVGLTSIGGGSLVMVSLLLFFPRWKMGRRVGTDVFQGFLLSAAAGAAQWHLGTVSLPLAGQLLVGSLPGVLIGSRLTKIVPEPVLRPAVAGALAISAWRLL